MSTITATFKELQTTIPSTGNTITHKLFSSNNDIWCDIVVTGSEGSFIELAITGYTETFKYRLLPDLRASINLKGIISRMINYAPSISSLTDLQERTDTIKQFEITFTYGAATDVKTLTVLKAAQQVQSTYGEFSSEFAILDVDATEEQYKMKFLSCFENPKIYTKTSGGVTVQGKFVDFTNPSLYTTINALIEDNKWHIQNGDEGTVYLTPLTFPTTISNVDAYYRIRYNYENVSSPVLKMYYYLDNGVAYPSVGVEMYDFTDFQNGTDIGGGLKELVLHRVNYTPNSPSWRLEVVLLSGDIDLYIHEIETYFITTETLTIYPFTLDFIHSESGLAYKERVLKTHQTNSGLTSTQQTDKYINPTNDIAVIDLQMNDYLAATNENNVDKFLSVWLENIIYLSFTTDQSTLSTLGMYFEFSENSELTIDFGDGNTETYTATNMHEIYHDYDIEGIYNGKVYFGKIDKCYYIDISDEFGINYLTSITVPKELSILEQINLNVNKLESINLQKELTALKTLSLSNNLFESIVLPSEYVNIEELSLANNNLTTVTIPNTYTKLLIVSFENCNLNEASINNILILLDNSGIENGFAILEGGTNSSPTGAGLTARTNLINKGWSISNN